MFYFNNHFNFHCYLIFIFILNVCEEDIVEIICKNEPKTYPEFSF